MAKKMKLTIDESTDNQGRVSSGQERVVSDEPPSPPYKAVKPSFKSKINDAVHNMMNPKINNSGKKSMLIAINNFVADVKMSEKCIGCEYNHHFLTKEQRDAFNQVMNRISFEHEASKTKKLFRSYKKFSDVDTICLSDECPFELFRGDKK